MQLKLLLSCCYISDHKEKGQPKTNLWKSETEPGGHEVTLCTAWSYKSVNASVSSLSICSMDWL